MNKSHKTSAPFAGLVRPAGLLRNTLPQMPSHRHNTPHTGKFHKYGQKILSLVDHALHRHDNFAQEHGGAEERENFLRALLDAASDGIMAFNDLGVVAMANPAAERIFGYPLRTLTGVNIAALVLMARAQRQTDSKSLLEIMGFFSSRSEHGECETTGCRKDGSTFMLEVAVNTFVLRAQTYHIVVVRDVTKRKCAHDKLKFLATRDPLTHLPNRYLFCERLRKATETADTTGSKIAILSIDLDHFKTINDAMGPAAGDAVLQLAGKRLEACVRGSDTVARLAGDEFTIIVEDVSGNTEVEAVASRMLHQLSRPFLVDGREIYTSGSIGVIVYPDTCDAVDELLKNVYTASHHAKEKGRNNVQFYSSNIRAAASRRVSIEHGLRHALDNDELSLAYQAKVDLKTGRIIGAEALARWNNPDLGEVSPVEFIPIAEKTGLIVPIGAWVLETACHAARQWFDCGITGVGVAVNLSARQFQTGALALQVQDILERTGLLPENLDLELTESLLVTNLEETVGVLRDLKTLGISLSIDDFGTGYSSLSYLTKFPLDSLKIDRSFVNGLPDDQDAVTMARAIIDMARNLRFKIIAEGVETARQSAFLQDLGCDIGQGYHFSRPVSYDDFVHLAQTTHMIRATP